MQKEFFLKTSELKDILNSIQSICQKKTIIEDTQNCILLFSENETLIKATDGETSVEIYLNSYSKSTFNEKIEISVNAKRFFDLIKDLLDEEIKLKIFNESLLISTNSSKINLSLSANKPLQEPFSSTENLFSIQKEKFLNMISFCMPLATTTASTINSNNIIFFEVDSENFSATSTDGHSLAHILFPDFKNESLKNFSFSISKKAASDLKKILELCPEKREIIIGKTKNEIVFSNEFFTVYVKILIDKFPDYKKILKTVDHKNLEIKDEFFLNSLKRLSCMTAGRFIPAKMKVKDGNFLTFDLENKEIGNIHEEIEISNFIESQGYEISFHPPYLLQAASSISNQKKSEGFNLLIQNEKKPLILSHNEPEQKLFYLVMPMISM